MLFIILIIFILIIYFLKNKNKNITQFENTNDINIYNFNTSWCGWSKKFQPEWNKLSNIMKTIDIKCDDPLNENICKKYNILGYPTVIIEKNNKQIVYNGEKTAESILLFVKSL